MNGTVESGSIGVLRGADTAMLEHRAGCRSIFVRAIWL